MKDQISFKNPEGEIVSCWIDDDRRFNFSVEEMEGGLKSFYLCDDKFLEQMLEMCGVKILKAYEILTQNLYNHLNYRKFTD